jgi:hypothetical protein
MTSQAFGFVADSRFAAVNEWYERRGRRTRVPPAGGTGLEMGAEWHQQDLRNGRKTRGGLREVGR